MNAIVYIAYCKGTGKAYVGCSLRSMRQRRDEHIMEAMNGSPLKFHKALRELGAAAFEWRVLETCHIDDRFARERHWVTRYNSFRAGYNSTPGGAGSKADGIRHWGRGTPSMYATSTKRKPSRYSLSRRR